MPNGFEHPLHGEEFPQAVKGMLEAIAAEAAKSRVLHEQLDYLRSVLKERNQKNLAFDARNFAYAASENFVGRPEWEKRDWWKILQLRYINYAMANDDDFWAAMHLGADELEFPPAVDPFP
jgi:hypothetical protein